MDDEPRLEIGDGHFFLGGTLLSEPPRVNIEGNFNRSHHLKEKLLRSPIYNPVVMILSMPKRLLVPSFTPKSAGFIVDQEEDRFSVCLGSSLTHWRLLWFFTRIEMFSGCCRVFKRRMVVLVANGNAITVATDARR
ncbi:hypothetical protein L1887_00663 [Cichorium endivia]|nr:hypothetical protein L1887_00663 [Cichorium endivia]